MELNADMKKQLMALAGMTEQSEFDDLVRKLAPSVQEAKIARQQSSPFHIHFIRLVAHVEAEGLEKFDNLGVEDKIGRICEIIETDRDLKSLLTGKLPEGGNNAEESKVLRDRGNKSYAKRDFETALGEYDAAVLVAGNGREAALAVGNRSAVFFETKDYERCLDDIEAAIDIFGFPEQLRYKLLDRKARCLSAMGDSEAARQAFSRAALAVQKSSALKESKKLQVQKDIETARDALSSASKPCTRRDFQCPFALWERHKNFPPLSDCLDIVYNDKVGRHVVATRPIRAGEALTIEDPIASHLSPHRLLKNCSHCFRQLGPGVFPSPLMPRRFRFCGLRCVKAAMATYHPLETAVDLTHIFYGEDESVDSQLSGCISLAYRAVTQKGLAFFKANKNTLFNAYDVTFGADIDKQNFSYTGDAHYRGLFNLVTHSNLANARDRLALAIRSAVLLKCLKLAGFFQVDDEEDEKFIGRLLYHFQSGIQYNLHTIYQVEGKIEAAKKIPLLDIGAGVYPTTLFFNHSCCPNTVRINQGSRVVFVAKRNINKGEEVTDCYGIHHLSLNKEARAKALWKGYAFKCSCTGCQDNLPLLAELPIQLPAKVAAKLGTTLSKYKSSFEEGKIDRALRACQDYLSKLEEMNVQYPHRNFEIAVMALCSCLWESVKNA